MISKSEAADRQAGEKTRGWKSSLRVHAWFCALTLIAAALLIHPSLEMGINDDWSYIKSAQVLAQTGHIAYNGWSTAMLGWQLYLGALAVKLFGFSFTAVRLSMLLPAMLAAFLMQRSFVRSGVNEFNATAGTLGIILSPLFLPLSFTFMTDIPGLLILVLCFYCCLRVLQAASDRARLGWLMLAVASNAFGGTVRQIAWLGVMVMVPSLLWMERRRRILLVPGIVATLAGLAVAAWSVHWFHTQPYSLPESLLPGALGLKVLLNLGKSLVDVVLEFSVLLLPLLICFVPQMPLRQRFPRLLAGLALLFTVAAAVAQYRFHRFSFLLAPVLGNCITQYGLLDVGGINGARHEALPEAIRVTLSLLGIASLMAFAAVYWSSPARHVPVAARRITGRQLTWLIAPFLTAYVFLLMPRGAFALIFDRYLLPPVFFIVLALLRRYQERVRARLPVLAIPAFALFALFAVAGTHDYFSLSRARLAAINEVRAANVPANQISGTFEYNSWNEVERTGFVAEPRLHGGMPPLQRGPSDECAPPMGYLAPHLDRRYALSSSPASCVGATHFAPVTYRTWLPPWHGVVYVVRDRGAHDGHL